MKRHPKLFTDTDRRAQSVYRCTLDDGFVAEITAHSAGEAIQRALEDHRGFRVVGCNTGFTQTQADRQNALGGVDGKLVMAAATYFYVPPHEPIPADRVIPRGRARSVDGTVAMFREDEISGRKPKE